MVVSPYSCQGARFRTGLFPEDIDTSDPWQFRNVLVR
jgi:homospermidine synthase